MKLVVKIPGRFTAAEAAEVLIAVLRERELLRYQRRQAKVRLRP